MTQQRTTLSVEVDPHSVARAEDGEVKCICGWMSGTHRWIGNAWDAYYAHYAEMRSTMNHALQEGTGSRRRRVPHRRHQGGGNPGRPDDERRVR